MNFDLSEIEFSRNDRDINVRLPMVMSESLAHFTGIHIGDGHLSKSLYDYRADYNGHFINESYWYKNYLSKLVQQLFNKRVTPTKGHNTIKISICSKAIHSFLSKICGLPVGPKTNCDIPEIIKNSNLNMKKAFLRGLADTDFSLVFKNRHKNINYYPVIDFQTSNRILRDSVILLLESLGFDLYSNQRMKKRKDTAYQSYYFQINGIPAFKKWMKEIGFTNHNQITKIKVWKKCGFVPPNTNINHRIAMLNTKNEFIKL